MHKERSRIKTLRNDPLVETAKEIRKGCKRHEQKGKLKIKDRKCKSQMEIQEELTLLR